MIGFVALPPIAAPSSEISHAKFCHGDDLPPIKLNVMQTLLASNANFGPNWNKNVDKNRVSRGVGVGQNSNPNRHSRDMRIVLPATQEI